MLDSWLQSVMEEQMGEGPEEELDSGAEPASEGRSKAKRVQGGNGTCSPAVFGNKERDGKAAPRRFIELVYEAFLVVLVAACGVFVDLSFAVNSCFTLRAIASVSTL